AMIGPSIMNYFVNGVVDNRRGNTNPHMAPHGVYPCRGDDRWITIAVQTDAQWQSLRSTLDLPDHESWRTMAGRLDDTARLDTAVAAATASHDSNELMHVLQGVGVAAGAVHDARDIVARDLQLAARGHWVQLDHPEMG